MGNTVISSVKVCQSCKYTNPEKSKFCMQCGSPLTQSGEASKKVKLIQVDSGKEIAVIEFDSVINIGKTTGDVKIKSLNGTGAACELALKGDMVTITSAGNENKLFIEAEPGKSIDLSSGKEFILGNTRFKVEL